jgi:hypothetical protein
MVAFIFLKASVVKDAETDPTCKSVQFLDPDPNY